jgi:hypothetical protein
VPSPSHTIAVYLGEEDLVCSENGCRKTHIAEMRTVNWIPRSIIRDHEASFRTRDTIANHRSVVRNSPDWLDGGIIPAFCCFIGDFLRGMAEDNVGEGVQSWT